MNPAISIIMGVYKEPKDSIAKEGRKFVEQYHNYIEIAQQYIDIFTAV